MSTLGDKTVIVPSPTNGQQVSIFFPTPLRVLQTPLTCIGPHKEKPPYFVVGSFSLNTERFNFIETWSAGEKKAKLCLVKNF